MLIKNQIAHGFQSEILQCMILNLNDIYVFLQVQQITDYWTEKVDLAYEQKVKEIGGRKSK